MMNNVNPTDTGFALLMAQQSQAQQSAQSLKEAREMEQIEAAAQEFEAVFLAEMIKPMFAGIKTDETFGGGKGEDVFTGMMIQEYGKNLAASGGIGIAEHVKAELIRIQQSQ